MSPAQVSVDLLGLPVRFSGEPGALAALGELYAPFATVGDGHGAPVEVAVQRQEAGWALFVGNWLVATGPSWEGLLPALATELNQRCIATLRHFACHAGVVASGSTAVAFPGRSGAGKSTAVAACVRAGFDYVSDEALVLRADGTVLPYPRPVSLTAWSAGRLGLAAGDDGEEVLLPAGRLGPVAGASVLAVRHVVLLERGAPARLEEVPRGEAAVTLLRHSFNHFRDPRGAVRLCTAVAAGARCWRLASSDPREVPEALLGQLRPG